jgi:hypothetical protein
MRGARLLQRNVLLAFLLVLPAQLLAQVSADNALTNADIVRMMKAGIPESIIVRKIQVSRPDFGTSASDLIELKNHGASERILGAVLDSRSGTSPSPLEQPLPVRTPVQSVASGPHHLPTFEAAVKLNATTTDKISVGKNHIKVEQAGVPVFSLKWKDDKK